MAVMKKVYNDLIIVNLYLTEKVSIANMEFPAYRIPRNQRTLHVILTELKNVRRSSRDLLKGSSFQIGTEKGKRP